MAKASTLKKGMVLEIDNQVYVVTHLMVKTPSARGAATLYKIKVNNLQSGQNMELNFKGDDSIKEVEVETVDVQYSYHDGENYIFMDTQNYHQIEVPGEVLDGDEKWLVENMEDIKVVLYKEKPISIQLPSSVELEVIDTAPAMKTASATSRTKPATLSNHAVVQIPEYIEVGEVLKINTETGKYMSRA